MGLDSMAVSLFGNMIVDTGEILINTKEYQNNTPKNQYQKKELNNLSDAEQKPCLHLVALALVKEEAASSAVCGEVWETWGGAEKSFETSPFHLEVESCNKCSSSETRT